jgi:hypothetical protein
MRGDKFKFNKSIIYSAILNLAYFSEFKEENQGCTIRDVFELCKQKHASIDAISKIIETLIAKNIIEVCGKSKNQFGARTYNATAYKLTSIGKQLLSKSNSELAILTDLINSRNN